MTKLILLKDFLFCLGFFVPLENFPFIWRHHHITIAGEGLQMLTYARHLCPLTSEGSLAWTSEGSLACHTYSDIGHPFIMITPIAERLAVELSPPVFSTYVCLWDSNTQPSA